MPALLDHSFAHGFIQFRGWTGPEDVRGHFPLSDLLQKNLVCPLWGPVLIGGQHEDWFAGHPSPQPLRVIHVAPIRQRLDDILCRTPHKSRDHFQTATLSGTHTRVPSLWPVNPQQMSVAANLS